MLLSSDDREVELRAHIRSLLSQYAVTHLATNYIAWTESEVANVRTSRPCDIDLLFTRRHRASQNAWAPYQ